MIARRSIPALLALLLASPHATGCATSVGITSGSGESSANAVRDLRITGDLDSLDLLLGEIRAARTRGGVLEAQVDVSNDSSDHNHFMYRFDWVDADGRVIPAQSSVWKAGMMPPRGRTVMSAVAPTPAASDFRLDIRARETE